jgi:hypothetical protein
MVVGVIWYVKANEKIQGEGHDVEKKKNFNDIFEHKAMKRQIKFFVGFNMLPSNFAEIKVASGI